MPTNLSNLWVPDIWVTGVAEKVRTLPALITSGIAVRTAEFDAFASGAAQTVNLPYFRDITDQTDAPQAERVAPTIQGITTGKQIATILNRESAVDATALAGQVSGTDPVGEMTRQLAMRRQKQRQTTLINILRGVFGTALASNRADHFDESGANADASQTLNSTKVINAAAKLGELQDIALQGGGILMHPLIRASLVNQDENDFERKSVGGLTLEFYKGLRIFMSNLLVRAGATDGNVFDTYVFGPRTVAWGEKTQAGDTLDVASLQYDLSRGLNVATIYDRTRFLMHVNGTRWTGTPSGQSASNAELATAGNWALDYSTADRVGVVQIRTNL